VLKVMINKPDYMSFTLGFALAWPIVLLIYVVVPDMKYFAITLAGVIFFSMGIVFKISVGMFYRKATLEDSPSGFWFNMGQAVGFIIFGLIV
jgi:hypothetical protein